MIQKDFISVRNRIDGICAEETSSHLNSKFLEDPIYVTMSSLFWKMQCNAYYNRHETFLKFFYENRENKQVFDCIWEISDCAKKSELIGRILIDHLNSIRSTFSSAQNPTNYKGRRIDFLARLPEKILSILEKVKNDSSFGSDVTSNQDLFSLKLLFGDEMEISPSDETTKLNLIKFELNTNSVGNSNNQNIYEIDRAIEFWYDINKNYYRQPKLFEDKWNRLQRGKGFLNDRKELCSEIARYGRIFPSGILSDILEQGYDSLKSIAVECLLSDPRTAPKQAFSQAEIIFSSIKDVNDIPASVPRAIAASLDKMGPLVMPNLGKTNDKYTRRLVEEFFDKNS